VLRFPQTRRLKDGLNISVELLQPSDVQDCVELIPKAAPDRWSKHNIESTLCNGSNPLFLGIKSSDDIIAFAIFTRVVDEMELLYIATRETFSGRGVAYALLSDALAYANEIQTVFLEVRESNLQAIVLYKKLGFTESGRRKHYYALPDAASNAREDAVLMHWQRA